ncbi:CLUMA_CG005544, isoform A [Clunio marinus]|uniref:CLUMA_CG005544, isoform A n=1 Tax=Clunio marinus TaxID=568069 RepID=A0A1J1HX44_9DIPT|nr:CLUMA_CG005544, isoform A [Clunio marinus]
MKNVRFLNIQDLDGGFEKRKSSLSQDLIRNGDSVSMTMLLGSVKLTKKVDLISVHVINENDFLYHCSSL